MRYYQYLYFFQLLIILVLKLEINKRLDVSALDLQNALDKYDEGERLDQERRANVSPFHFVEPWRRDGVNSYGQHQQQYKEFAGLEEDGQISKVKRSKHLDNNLPCRSEAIGAEENPQEDDKMQGDKPTNYPSYSILFQFSLGDFLPQLIDDKTHTMHATPEDELPVGTMPQASQQHSDKEV